MPLPAKKLRSRQSLGQYRIDRHLATGGFSSVYAATDTISGRRMALKVLHEPASQETANTPEGKQAFDDLKREVRMLARLDHPGIVQVISATRVDGRLLILSPLAKESLDERLTRRLGPRAALSITGDMLEALAYAHGRKVLHCDIKPANVLLLPDGRAQIADFGLARLATRTINASGSGTLGYMAPEQALGKPSLRSDVFSAGLVVYRMFAGAVPQWPFEWPFPGADRVRRTCSKEFIDWMRRAVQVDERKRFASCVPMLRAFREIEEDALRNGGTR